MRALAIAKEQLKNPCEEYHDICHHLPRHGLKLKLTETNIGLGFPSCGDR
jgi:hypothetical protein